MTALRYPSPLRVLAFLLVLLVHGFAARYALAEHGVAQYGELAYPPGFAHFKYANPAAPKGGTLVLSPPQRTGFDKFNPFSLKGVPAPGIGQLMFESLLTTSSDEVASAYGLLAESGPAGMRAALRRLMQDAPLRQKLGKCGRGFAAKFAPAAASGGRPPMIDGSFSVLVLAPKAR